MDADGAQGPPTPGLPIRPPPTLNSNSGNSASNSKLRKRTKTGCLTCRRRRIKCGEERPTCANCIKSKRGCEGYNQRLVFKTSIDGWPNGVLGPASTIPYHTSTIPGSQPHPGYHPEYLYAQHPTPHFGIPIDEHGRPIPLPSHLNAVEWPANQYALPSFTPVAPILPSNAMIPIVPNPGPMQQHTPQSGAFINKQSPPSTNSQFYQQSPNFDQSFVSLPHQASLPSASSNGHPPPGHQSILPTPPPTTYTDNPDGYAVTSPQNRSGGYFVPSSPNGHYPLASQPFSDAHITDVGFDQKPRISRNFTGAPLTVQSVVSPAGVSYITASSPFDLNAAAVEWHTEEYSSPWDSEEDRELTPEQALIHGQDSQQTLLMILQMHKHHAGDISVRDYNTFLYSGFLTQYEADKFASPLKNKHTARVFAHFLSATAPSLSIFERQPRNSSPIFCETPSQNALEGLWTYTLPVMALSHQGLLHAMLSLSSLHISKLQNDTSIPAFKHYAYAIKRVNRCVEHPAKRHNPTTLAATLLLGFYEVMTADHSKWCCHLAGAAKLLQEINYRDMAAYARMAAQDQEAQDNNVFRGPNISPGPGNERSGISHIDDILISRIVGRTYDRFPPQKMPAADFDLQKYHLYQDLFWWYARQDAYQSIIAGNRLMLDFHRWADCPPRAAIGRVDAIYGTHDHLFLLFGRIADFATKDRARKLRVMAANGGAWRPHPDMQLGPPPGQQQQNAPPGYPGQAPPSFQGPATGRMEPPPMQGPPASAPPRGQDSAPAMPSFFGLAPMPTQITMPASYSGHPTTPPYHSPTTSDRSAMDTDTQTQLALAEWNQMYSSLKELEAHFGPGFQPLEPDVYPFATPFGPAVLYPSYDIAVIWALYYAAHIVALRGHPHMPPFTHVASGVAARQTAEYANLIGRIAAGMMGDTIRQPVTPSLGATYSEMTMPLFIAGIQYILPDQRDWLVLRVREIEELTGWASVGMIALGCETAWEKAAAAGKGPPYVRAQPIPRLVETASSVRVPRRKRNPAGEPLSAPPGSDGQWQSGGANSSDSRGIRIHYAMGLLGEEDLDQDPSIDRRRLAEVEAAMQHPSPLSANSMSFRT